MASIWMQARGKAPVKLHGYLNGAEAVMKLQGTIASTCAQGKAALCCQHELEALLQVSDGIVSLYIEPYSPPSAPEEGQPVIKDGKGLVIDKYGKAHALPVPKRKGKAK